MLETVESKPDTTSFVDVSSDIARFAAMGLLPTLLADRSTGGNIIWASDAYAHLGAGFAATDEVWPMAVTGEHVGLVRTRASKARDVQVAFTKTHAEVFTPLWVCKMMVDEADRAWDSAHEEATWREYVSSRRLEITCGEAPYLVSRYDAADGTPVPLEKRVGILDRKLARIPRYFKRRSWITWAMRAVQSTYGYEFQGDNLLIARVNLLATVEDWCEEAGFSPLTQAEYGRLAEVVSWNLWQMDGLSDCVPFGEVEQSYEIEYTPTLFDVSEYTVGVADGQLSLFGEKTMPGLAKVYDWEKGTEVVFRDLKRKGGTMRFDYVIGNPPYQEEQDGDNANFAPPIYNKFMDGAFQVSNVVELIHPARFLFNQGSTPREWNQRMLDDDHFKVLEYSSDSGTFFPGVSIMGGIAISYRDSNASFGSIGVFTPHEQLNTILRKVNLDATGNLSSISFNQTKFNLEALYAEHSELRSVIGSNGRDKRFRNNIFSKVPLFTEERVHADDVAVLGVLEGSRVWRFFPRRFIDSAEGNLDSWKVISSSADGAAGVLGSPIPARISGVPSVLAPGQGYTQTFIGFGSFETEEEAVALCSYLKTRFARCMLGVLKITQDIKQRVWGSVPLQDFTSASDIDWSQSVSDIDQQLYEKYGLDDDEVTFIESHVKEMS